MNYSYVMGVKNIDELKKENFKIIPLKDDYGIIFDDNKAELYVLNNDNEKEILKLCCEFAECEFESIDKMLRDNEFYAENYYAENISDNIFFQKY